MKEIPVTTSFIFFLEEKESPVSPSITFKIFHYKTETSLLVIVSQTLPLSGDCSTISDFTGIFPKMESATCCWFLNIFFLDKKFFKHQLFPVFS